MHTCNFILNVVDEFSKDITGEAVPHKHTNIHMNSEQLYNLMFNMKFTAKQFEKSAKKSEKDSEKEKIQVKKALEKGNVEAARIYAENAIRKRNEGNNFLRLASRIDAAASRVETAVKMQAVTKVMTATVKGMEKVLTAMDPMQVAAVMDQFEQQVGSMDVSLQTMETTFNSAQSSVVPTNEVDTLMEQIADAHNIETRSKISGAQKADDPVFEKQDKEMTDLLEKLKGCSIGA